MRILLTGAIAAVALGIAAPAFAQAYDPNYDNGYNYGAPSAPYYRDAPAPGYYAQPGYDAPMAAPTYEGRSAAVGPSDADSVAYCEQRFRSYDPASGTYMGFDGIRHPCP